ncbi:MAG: serine hydrolase domain-containing protein [Thermomicrobiales bacterium]
MEIQNRLKELLAEFAVPGASVAVLDGESVETFTAGVASVDTRQPVTHDMVFPIGSITKVFTTTLIMQLVDAGDVYLDRRVIDYLPDLKLASAEQTQGVTIRHLLTHTSGIAGDHIFDTGSGPTALGRYVESLATLPELHPPGAMFSYSNSAFILAGQLLERMTNHTWADLVRSSLIDPLGLDSMILFPEDAGRRPIVSPHIRGSENHPVSGKMWTEFHAGAPAGFTPYASAEDVVRFARFHLHGGTTGDGRRLVSAAGIAEMQRPHVDVLPSGGLDATGWGLGWGLHRFGAERGLGHNGGTSAMLRVLPDRRFAVAVLTNISGGIRMGSTLIGELLRDRFGIQKPVLPPSESALTDDHLERYCGTYRHLSFTASIEPSHAGLKVVTGTDAKQSAASVELSQVGFDRFVGVFAERGLARAGFVGANIEGPADYFHMGLRAFRREP